MYKNPIYADCKTLKEKNQVYYQNHKEEMKARSKEQTGGEGESKLHQTKQKLKEKCNYTCCRCGKQFPSNRLHGHHVVVYQNIRDDSEDNIIIVCNSCHQKLHNILPWGCSIQERKQITEDFINLKIKTEKELKEEKQRKIKLLKSQLKAVQGRLEGYQQFLKITIDSIKFYREHGMKEDWARCIKEKEDIKQTIQDYKIKIADIKELINFIKNE